MVWPAMTCALVSITGCTRAQLFERTYSAGMKRRINVVAPILQRPALLVATSRPSASIRNREHDQHLAFSPRQIFD
jgi:hypothetical protein